MPRRAIVAAAGLAFGLLACIAPFLAWMQGAGFSNSGFIFHSRGPRQVLLAGGAGGIAWMVDGIFRRHQGFWLSLVVPLASFVASVLIVRGVLVYVEAVVGDSRTSPEASLAQGGWLALGAAAGLAIVGLVGLFVRPKRRRDRPEHPSGHRRPS